MLTIQRLEELSQLWGVPLEDLVFIALNINGISLDCSYNRLRTAFRLADSDLFWYAKQRGELDYYLALPVNRDSAFVVKGETLLLGDTVIGRTIGLTEDICDSNYPRRNGTSLNINPNSRTSCHGCGFCYTAYQVPRDRKKLKSEADLREFFENWMGSRGLRNLSHLIQISVVTGCYDSGENLCRFFQQLKAVVGSYGFDGKIFYLGSQLASEEVLDRLTPLRPFGICFSLEVFERRDLLRDKKRAVTMERACELMDFARKLGYEVNFSYIVGMESLLTMEKHFVYLREHINKFPTINTLQLHKFQSSSLRDSAANDLEYYLGARKLLEQIFSGTDLRPLVWEDYRGLWFLTFGGEPLYGIRTP